MSIKRKLESSGNPSAKRIHREDSRSISANLTGQKWKPLVLPDMGDWAGLLEVEELDTDSLPTSQDHASSSSEGEWKGIDHDSSDEEESEALDPQLSIAFDPSLLPNWPSDLHPLLLNSLHQRQFTKMTRIQSLVVTPAVLGTERDVIGIAQTGSGKTLAFGLPILHSILTPKPRSNGIQVLVITPTRELANQIKEHFELACDKKLNILSLTGGLSIQKQRRLLTRNPKPSVVIGSPGRISEHLSDGTLSFADLDHVVFDEFDKLFFAKQRGWKEEFETVCRELIKIEGTEHDENRRRVRKWFFSATSDEDIMFDMRRKKNKKKSSKENATAFISHLPFQLDDPFLADVTNEETNDRLTEEAPRIVESTIECMISDKDTYLYTFQLLHSSSDQEETGGKTMVFLNSIDGIRRLHSVMKLLSVPTLPLHSQMDQKSRLQSLERFSSRSSSILLTTDLASRGLDLPHVQNVISWNVPPSGEVYIHRIGRAARGFANQGFSCVFLSPEERGMWKDVLKSLNKSSNPPGSLPIHQSLIQQAKPRIALAKKIDELQHRVRKGNHEKKWEKEAREALGVDSASEDDDEGEGDGMRRKAKNEHNHLVSLKDQLAQLSSKRLVMPGVMTSFVTSGARPLVDVGISEEGGTLSMRSVVGMLEEEKDARGKVLNEKQRKKQRKT